jgi:hypothetical protein
MREGYRALVRRAAAAMGVSVALHLVVASLGGSLPLGAVLSVVSKDAGPLIVEMIAGDTRPPAPPPRAHVARSAPVRPVPVKLNTPRSSHEGDELDPGPRDAGAWCALLGPSHHFLHSDPITVAYARPSGGPPTSTSAGREADRHDWSSPATGFGQEREYLGVAWAGELGGLDVVDARDDTLALG